MGTNNENQGVVRSGTIPADERAAFEKSRKPRTDLHRKASGIYSNPVVQNCWETWQARATLPANEGERELTDAECHAIKERCAINADLWAESQEFEPSPEELSAEFIRAIECELANAAPAEVDALREENDKLRAALGDSALAATMLHEFSVKDGGINAVYSGGAAQLLAEALGQQFIESGAENYLEVGFNTSTGARLLVTLQRCDGKTPATFRCEAEEKLAEAMAELANAAPAQVKSKFDEQIFRTMVATWAHSFKGSHDDIKLAERKEKYWRSIMEYVAAPAGAVPEGWREELRSLRDNTETFGPHGSEAARIAIEGCIDALDELEAAAAPVPPVSAPADRVRDAALAEAAKLCLEWAEDDVPGAVKGRSIRLADAIRALRTSPASSQEGGAS
jgi:hypothetical protein